jgi:hypothetical protein
MLIDIVYNNLEEKKLHLNDTNVFDDQIISFLPNHHIHVQYK